MENQRKKKLLDDVPLSIRINLEDQHKKKTLDDVPLSIRRNLEPQQAAITKEDKLKRRRYLLDDLPMSIKKELEKSRQQPEEQPDLDEQAKILKSWRQREILNGTSKGIQDKIQERRRKQLLDDVPFSIKKHLAGLSTKNEKP